MDSINYACWRHQMETFSALLALCAGNAPVTGEFPSQRSVTRSFDVFIHRHRAHYDVIHCNGILTYQYYILFSVPWNLSNLTFSLSCFTWLIPCSFAAGLYNQSLPNNALRVCLSLIACAEYKKEDNGNLWAMSFKIVPTYILPANLVSADLITELLTC